MPGITLEEIELLKKVITSGEIFTDKKYENEFNELMRVAKETYSAENFEFLQRVNEFEKMAPEEQRTACLEISAEYFTNDDVNVSGRAKKNFPKDQGSVDNHAKLHTVFKVAKADVLSVCQMGFMTEYINFKQKEEEKKSEKMNAPSPQSAAPKQAEKQGFAGRAKSAAKTFLPLRDKKKKEEPAVTPRCGAFGDYAIGQSVTSKDSDSKQKTKLKG